MSKLLQVNSLSDELLQTLISNRCKDSEASDVSIHSIESVIGEIFNSSNSINESKYIFVNMFYDFIKSSFGINSLKRLYMIDKSMVTKRIESSIEILNVCDNIIYDISMALCNDKSSYDINIIGGKIVDLFLGKKLCESSGDFDVWIPQHVFKNFRIKELLSNNLNYSYKRIDDQNPSCLSFESEIYDGTIIKVQIICKEFDDVDSIFSLFDFLHCCVGYDGKNIFWRQGALKAIKHKNIIINNISPTRIANERLDKYINRGFNITYPNFIMLSINTLLSAISEGTIIPDNSTSWSFAMNNEVLRELRSSNVY